MQCVTHSSLDSGWKLGNSKSTSGFTATSRSKLLGTIDCHQVAATTLRRNTIAAKSGPATLAGATTSLVATVPEASRTLAAAPPSLAQFIPEATAARAAATPSLAPIVPGANTALVAATPSLVPARPTIADRTSADPSLEPFVHEATETLAATTSPAPISAPVERAERDRERALWTCVAGPAGTAGTAGAAGAAGAAGPAGTAGTAGAAGAAGTSGTAGTAGGGPSAARACVDRADGHAIKSRSQLIVSTSESFSATGNGASASTGGGGGNGAGTRAGIGAGRHSSSQRSSHESSGSTPAVQDKTHKAEAIGNQVPREPLDRLCRRVYGPKQIPDLATCKCIQGHRHSQAVADWHRHPVRTPPHHPRIQSWPETTT